MIPSADFGGAGEPVHFLHANGYPPACYEPFIDRLSAHYRVFGMLLRPLWGQANPLEIQDWNPFSADLLTFLDQRAPGPVIGIGHSIGAVVTLRAALQQPQRFRGLVLMDPVLFPPYYMLEWNLVRRLRIGGRANPLIQAALNRRREFDDLEKLFAGYRRRPVFRFFSDENLRALIAGLTLAKPGGGYELVFSPEWEARIYYTGIWHDADLWRRLGELTLPTLILRGAQTDTFWESTARRVARKNPRIKIVTLAESTHLLPMERPAEVFEIARSFLQEAL